MRNQEHRSSPENLNVNSRRSNLIRPAVFSSSQIIQMRRNLRALRRSRGEFGELGLCRVGRANRDAWWGCARLSFAKADQVGKSDQVGLR